MRVTVEPGSRSDTRRRIARVRSLAPVIAVVGVALAAAAGLDALADRTADRADRTADRADRTADRADRTAGRADQPVHAPTAQARNAGPIGVAAAYRYPLACLSVTIAKADPAYAAARLDRVSPCWRYGAYATTILHRVAGVWRVALETSGASCAISSIPAAVLAELGLCAGGRAPPPAAGKQHRGGQARGGHAVRNDWDLPRALNAAGSES